jgi:hypothetical protein
MRAAIAVMTWLMHRGSLASYKPLRIYQGENGIWRYEIERFGKVRWSSLHTRDESKARAVWDRMVAALARWEADPFS